MLKTSFLQLSNVGCPTPTVRLATVRCHDNNLVTMSTLPTHLPTPEVHGGAATYLPGHAPWTAQGPCTSCLCQPTSVGAWKLGRHGPPPCTLKSSHRSQAPTRELPPPWLGWPELVRPARPLSLWCPSGSCSKLSGLSASHAIWQRPAHPLAGYASTCSRQPAGDVAEPG